MTKTPAALKREARLAARHAESITTTGTWVLSYGMGVDSSAIILRWLADPASRPPGFKLDDLIVVTAQTGDEYPETIRLVETYILPLLREHGIRFVELAKAGPLKGDGIKVLQDTREPIVLHLSGGYKLSDELRASGTVPQFGSTRKCSIKFKGEPIDAWLHANLPYGRYLHVMGYELNEPKRARDDTIEGAKNKLLGHRRDPAYPLIEWGWNRDACLAYIAEATGAAWAKSACTFCPFAEDRGIGRISCGQAVETMKLEAVCVALNPRQTLFAEKKSENLLASAIELYERDVPGAGDAYLADIADGEWTCYEVKRAWTNVGAKGKAGTGGNTARELRTLKTGTAAACHKELRARAKVRGTEVVIDRYGFMLTDISPKPDFGSGIEHRIVVAPAGAENKKGRNYDGYLRAVLADAA